MDFMKWLNSLDEFLYEVMSWLLFFPVTLWRALMRPLTLMEEIARQAALPDEEQYAAVLSPPLFLALALIVSHALAVALGQTDAIVANRHGLGGLINDNTSALILRVIVFAAFPLFLAARLVRAGGRALDRQSLRQPFYEQCYPTAVFALLAGAGTSLALVPAASVRSAGLWLVAAGFINFVVVEVRWFAKSLDVGRLRAAANVLVAVIEGLAFLLLVSFLFTRS